MDVLESLERGSVSEAHADLIYWFGSGDFFIWEAVIRQEQGLELSEGHRDQLSKLISFGDRPGSERIQYINEMPRPDAPWYEYVRRLAPLLLVDEIDTTALVHDFDERAWYELTEAIHRHACGLELPLEAEEVWDVLDEELRYELDLQSVWLDALAGMRAFDEMSSEDRAWRLGRLIDGLHESIEAVAYFDLTIADIFDRVTIPDDQTEYLAKGLIDELNVERDQPLADALEAWEASPA